MDCSKDVERLISEWKAHNKIILAVDYDDTIFPWRHRSMADCFETIELVKWAKNTGAYIMIHTASDDTRHEEIKSYCFKNGLMIDSINKNPIELPYGQQGKPYYNWQLCDRSGLEYAQEVLKKAIVEIYKYKKENV